ncbi:unnamed protein product [Owenia fusiformis]|uniref:Fringe-like glycosyltransferase domain-containing protein n=1 Tax=Owenia fusiformis TaxID=6347 RepID=A0A8S4Q5R3_OWEFU|nr:unnamed protein product [Owenia fusiformis]
MMATEIQYSCIYDGYKDTIQWVVFCEEETRIDLKKLINILSKYDQNEPHFLGKALRDKEATIIHHFKFIENPSKFAFPDFAAGFAISRDLLISLQKKIRSEVLDNNFSIDPKHELALYIWKDGEGHELTEQPGFCTANPGPECATLYTTSLPQCGSPVDKDDIYIAVKTCEKFHKDRVPIVLKTWGKHVPHIEYISETLDNDIPTVETGLPNTESGHCGKLEFILKRAATHPELISKPWIVVADDDTVLSFNRLRRFLSCYDPNERIVIGERYGYGVAKGYGYNYPTGGGGMVFSRAAIEKLMFDGDRPFNCPSLDTPDDMILGSFCRGLNIPLVHSPLFHQARPDDYSEGYLSWQSPISFHKHWNNDPIKVYDTWFKEADLEDIDGKEYNDNAQQNKDKDEL